VVSFLIVAFAIFMVIRNLNRLQRQEEAPPPTTRECPYCLSSIAIKATRCAQCTADLKAA
jgi:large conductance mechanosensitive channel